MNFTLTRHGTWRPARPAENRLFQQSQLSDVPGSFLEVVTTAAHLHVPLLHHAWSGVVELAVDGRPWQTIDLFAREMLCAVYRLDLPGDGRRSTVTVRLTGDRNPGTGACLVYVGRVNTDAGVYFTPERLVTGRASVREEAGRVLVALRGDADPMATPPVPPALVRPGDTVLECGAGSGLRTLALAARVGPAGRVYCFEPAPRAFNALCANLLFNDCDRAIPCRHGFGLPDAVGDPGPATLDEFVARARVERVDVLVVDWPGHAGAVLAGAAELLKRWRPGLDLTLAPGLLGRQGVDYRDLLGGLAELGYLFYDVDSYPLVPHDDAPDTLGAECWRVLAVTVAGRLRAA